jgi:uncharacterized repeat protein (TIGR01451 family)
MMSWIAVASLALGRRGAIVVSLLLVAAFAGGASSVLAGGSSGRPIVARSASTVAPVVGHGRPGRMTVGRSYRNDRSRPLWLAPAKPLSHRPEREANANPSPVSRHRDAPDTVRHTEQFAPNMPSTTLNFDGIAFPGVGCNCAPPDTNGEVGATQYVQIVNQGFQVFNKSTGVSLLGPTDVATVWSGFGGVCETSGFGDPVVVYDQLADRWVISQFAGAVDVATDECVAVSTSNDATGTWNRYGFHLGSDFFDYPKLGVWPDGYYLTMSVFDGSTSDFLGPQPFALDRSAMLAGNPATFLTTTAVRSSSNDLLLPADLDGSTPPPAAAPEPFLMSGQAATWKLWRFHADFATPANSTFTLGGNLTPAAYSALCPAGPCVPQLGTSDALDSLGDRGMFRLAYRNFGDHEALVGNQSVLAGGVGAIRWYEIGNATSGSPAFTQQSTYQPDTTWRWMGSAAMDHDGNLAIGFSASNAAINPQIRYAGRLAADAANTLARGEAHLFNGTGSQRGTNGRWGDYSDLTVDPVDDCTFWYTNEYYSTTSTFNWRTRIGAFKFPSCSPSAGAQLALGNTTDAPTVSAGSQIGFTVSLTNSGTDAATGVSVTDLLPSRTGVNWAIDSANSTPGDWSITGSPPNQSLAGPATVAGATETHVHLVSATTAGSCGAFTNSAAFDSSNAGSGSASASTTVTCVAPVCTVGEGFPDVGGLEGAGWHVQNNSSPVGATSWFQGNPAAFAAQAGTADSYVAANYQNTGNVGTISDWLLTPVVTLRNGAQFTFWTRKIDEVAPDFFPDRLQVRMSTNGMSTNVGATSTSVGDFSRLLLDINPTYASGGYPFGWTKYTVTVSGLGSVLSGRFGFRYFVEGAGLLGTRADYVGIDTVAYGCTPPLPPPPAPPPPPPPHSLAVSKTGTGAGTVTSSPSGISCGATCVATFTGGTAVTLKATPAAGSRFLRWTGDCAGATCQLTMSTDHFAVAEFAKVVRCKVPKVLGLTPKKAKGRIVRAHCRVGKITKRFSTARKRGRVIGQKPKAGRLLTAGTKVNFSVGKGPRR